MCAPFYQRLADALAPRPTAGSLAKFYHQLAAMLHSGLTIVRALETVEASCPSGMIRRRIPLMRARIEGGGTASDAFALFPRIFGPVHIAMIQAGEHAGRLDETLAALSEMSERRAALAKTFTVGILYPALLLNFAFFALPFVRWIQQQNTLYWKLALPPLLVFYGVVALIVAGPRIARQYRGAAYAMDRAVQWIPVCAGVSWKLALARLARSLNGLYGSGTNFAEALPMAAEACGNEILRRRVLAMAPMIEAGRPLSQAMRAVGGFPVAFLNMMETGEESGELSQMLTHVAAHFEDEAETALRRLMVVLPVVVYLGVAAYIGYAIISFYVGYYDNIFRQSGLGT